MDKEELNAKLGYNRELLNQLSNAFDLQEDYNDYGWDKLFEICRYIYNLEQQCKKQKEVIDRILNETKETRNILNNNRDDNMLSKSCLLSYLEIVEDLLKEVSE